MPILHVEVDQHEPEDPLHRSTARALTAIAAQFHKQGELKDSPLDVSGMNETTTQDGRVIGTLGCRHDSHADCLNSLQQPPPPAAEQHITIACVEVTDTLAEDVINIATCLSINAIILLFHITHYHATPEYRNSDATNGRDINTRGHTPFASGPVSAPFTIQHRGPSEFQVACDAFGVGVYDSDYPNQSQPPGSTTTDHKINDTPPRINALGHHTLQGALDLAEYSGTKTDANSTCTPPQSNKRGSKPADQHHDTLTAPQAQGDRHGKTRRSRSVANPVRTSGATPRGGNGTSIMGSTLKPTWRVKNVNPKEDTPGNTAEPNTHRPHRRTPARSTPPTPTTQHSSDLAPEVPERDNITKQDACHDTHQNAQQPGLKQQPPNITPDQEPLDLCPHITNARIAATYPHHIKDLIH